MQEQMSLNIFILNSYLELWEHGTPFPFLIVKQQVYFNSLRAFVIVFVRVLRHNSRPLTQRLCASQIEASTSPRATPRAFEFFENFCSNSPSRGRKAVQMPHYRSIPGDQMPPSPGNFSVAFIMLRKLCM